MQESTQSEFDVCVLAASTGGEVALMTILPALPRDFLVPIVVVQHLPPESTVIDVYRRRVPGLQFEWLGNASVLTPRKVLLCPPRSFAEVMPDGSCRVGPCPGGAVERPMDRLFESVARSFAHRAIGVVLTGMAADAAEGARGLHLVGGRVIVQSERSAQSSEMPRAAIEAGAADVVVALPDIAQVISEIAAGTPRPKTRSEQEAIGRLFGTQGDVAARARDIDWGLTPLGPVIAWPASLRLLTRTAIEAVHPAAIWWGAELIQIYNDAWRRLLGAKKHAGALGRPARQSWPEVWDEIGPMIERVKLGASVGGEDQRFVIDRDGDSEEVYLTFGFSPIRDESGAVVGVSHTALETTTRVIAERRLAALHALAAQIVNAGSPRDACERAAAALDAYPHDVPFALLYLVDGHREQATLAGATGVAPGSPAAPYIIPTTADGVWPLQRVLHARGDDSSAVLHDLPPALEGIARSFGPAPRRAYLVPLRFAKGERVAGVLVAAISPYRAFDDAYRSFVESIAQRLDAGLGEARVRQREHERIERLADLDRAKTDFVANVTHEFRTPLTLLLTSLDQLLDRREELPVFAGAEAETAARSSRRLLRLVDDLLDFSQIEQGRGHVMLEPADLGALTADVASAFRSAIETAGLALHVTCEAGLPPVPVHREMWEKIVSNLLSNALKFTFDGEIRIAVHALALHAQVTVADTGIGIPDRELPNLFKRFYRVRGARARTLEGSGIGLSIVHDLVGRMGGQIVVRSREGEGTSFTIWLPYKSHRPVADARSSPPAAGRFAAHLADVASRWSAPVEQAAVADDLLGEPPMLGAAETSDARLLVVDDNADLRDYLRRLLGARWRVELAADGATALERIRRQRPDLVLADVMMPALDGFALLERVRHDNEIKHTPIILLTARAGEQAAVDGLLAGADDYIAKPFSPRELVARVRGQLELSRMRRRVEELDAFLVRFSDAVRGTTDERRVKAIACRMLVEHLGAERAHWAEVDWETREYVVESAFAAGEKAIHAEGRHALDAWQPSTEILLAGRSMVIEDRETDPRISPTLRERMTALAMGARIAVPVTAEGALAAVLSVNQLAPRRWAPEEIGLIESVAGRCWAEVMRARAETALRESEENYRSLFEAMEEGYALCEVVRDGAGRPVELAVLHGNAAFHALVGADLGAFLAPCAEALERGATVHLERFVAAPGRWYATRVHPRTSDRVAVLFDDITEHKLAEQSLRALDERKTFLLKLSDELRSSADALEIKAAANRILGEHLRTDRTYYVELDRARGLAVLERDYVRGDGPSLAGEHPIAAFEATLANHRAGKPFVCDDAQLDARIRDADRPAYLGRGLRSFVTTPLVKGGEFMGAMSVTNSAPRAWLLDEVQLVVEVAERTWDAVQRARAEAELRASEEKYRSLFEIARAGRA